MWVVGILLWRDARSKVLADAGICRGDKRQIPKYCRASGSETKMPVFACKTVLLLRSILLSFAKMAVASVVPRLSPEPATPAVTSVPSLPGAAFLRSLLGGLKSIAEGIQLQGTLVQRGMMGFGPEAATTLGKAAENVSLTLSDMITRSSGSPGQSAEDCGLRALQAVGTTVQALQVLTVQARATSRGMADTAGRVAYSADSAVQQLEAMVARLGQDATQVGLQFHSGLREFDADCARDLAGSLATFGGALDGGAANSASAAARVADSLTSSMERLGSSVQTPQCGREAAGVAAALVADQAHCDAWRSVGLDTVQELLAFVERERLLVPLQAAGYLVAMLLLVHAAQIACSHSLGLSVLVSCVATGFFCVWALEPPVGTVRAWLPPPNTDHVRPPCGWQLMDGARIATGPRKGAAAADLTDGRFLRGSPSVMAGGLGEGQHGSHTHAVVDPGHAHADGGHTHFDTGHTHDPVPHHHSSPAHAHDDVGHTHGTAPHGHADAGHEHRDTGHSHPDGGHAHADRGHTHVDRGHAHATDDFLSRVGQGRAGGWGRRYDPTVQAADHKTSGTHAGLADLSDACADIAASTCGLGPGHASIAVGRALLEETTVVVTAGNAALTPAAVQIDPAAGRVQKGRATLSTATANVARAVTGIRVAPSGGTENVPKHVNVCYIMKVTSWTDPPEWGSSLAQVMPRSLGPVLGVLAAVLIAFYYR